MGVKNIFLTGEIQVGKSTAIAKFIEKYVSKSSSILGFKTKPFYENGFLTTFQKVSPPSSTSGEVNCHSKINFSESQNLILKSLICSTAGDDLKGYYIESQMNSEFSDISESIIGINTDFGKGKCCLGITETFEKKGVEILSESLEIPNSIILMDELGFFEKDAVNFKNQVYKTLDSSHKVLGVIKERRNEFLNSIASREDVKVIRVTLQNRDFIVEEINKYWE